MTIKDDILKLSKELIAIKSTEDNIDNMQACMDVFKREFGDYFHITEYKFNNKPALVLSTTKEKKIDYILSGHIDVVPGNDNLFEPRIEGDNLFGRGAYDMKANLVAGAYAFQKYVQNTQESDRKELAILITTDEEVSGYGTKMLLEQEGYRAEFAIIIDGGSEKELVLKQKGFAQLVITTHGTGGHASAPWTTKNPIDSLTEVMEKVHERFPLPDSSQWVTTAVLTKIDSENSLNQIPESAKGYIDVRLTDMEDLNIIISLIEDCLRKSETVTVLESNGLFFVDVDNKNVADIKDILEEEMKTSVEFSFENGTSDAIFFTEHAIPASLFRPKGGGAHMDSEWVSIDSLLSIFNVVYKFLIKK